MSAELIDSETGEIVTALVRPDSWSGATTRALEARKEREAIVSQILREGHDFGTVPGCGDKPALLKAGAEKIADALNLYPDYEDLDKVQDFVNRVWFYRYRCRLRQRGTDVVMSTGIGSCNSEAAKYKYRDAQRVCPQCGKPAIIKGREEYGGGWLCFQRKGGCGAKFIDGAKEITEQQVGQIENPDIASLVNTVDKMAQKSAFVAACLNLGFSEQFTQDTDDNPQAFDRPIERQERPVNTAPAQAENPKPDPAPVNDVPKCPECSGPVWDNRVNKRNPKAPDFKCKDKSCKGVIWKETKKNVESTMVKQAIVDAFKVLNQAGDSIVWSSKIANEWVAEQFDGCVIDQLDEADAQKLLQMLSKRLDGLKDTRKPSLIAVIKSNFPTEELLANYLDSNWEGQKLEDMSIEQLVAVEQDATLPF